MIMMTMMTMMMMMMVVRPEVYTDIHTPHAPQEQAPEVAPEALSQSGMTSPGYR